MVRKIFYFDYVTFRCIFLNVKYQCEISDFDFYSSTDSDCFNCLLQQTNDQSNNRDFKDLGNFNAGVENAISGVQVVQAFANEPHEKGRFRVLNQAYRQSKLMFYKVMGLSFRLTIF